MAFDVVCGKQLGISGDLERLCVLLLIVPDRDLIVASCCVFDRSH